MNTRGLMELIVLNIGLDLKVISDKLYAMLVIMALVTTMATTPVLQWLGKNKSLSSE
jgi:Kef-type K+ transport system membrane component KefB